MTRGDGPRKISPSCCGGRWRGGAEWRPARAEIYRSGGGFENVGPLTLTAKVNGVPLPPETFSTSSEATYARDVPASALQRNHNGRVFGGQGPGAGRTAFPRYARASGRRQQGRAPAEMTRGVTPAQLRRAACFLIAPAVCLILFWRVPGTWFLNDDFAWLGMPLEVHSLYDFFHVLFIPKAQGTIRVLSERLFFLTFSSVFGLHALPYRLWVLATWFGDLTLANLIGARLTGSRAAGILAALLWARSACVTTPLVWASAYNEILCAFCILAAFYARLRWLESGSRKWLVGEWAAYLAGFGALEVIVMYPAVAALHALLMARKRFWSTLPLFAPAVAFTCFHFFFIPVVAGPYYTLAVDRRLLGNFLTYIGWAIEPGQLSDLSARIGLGVWIITLTCLALTAFVGHGGSTGETG